MSRRSKGMQASCLFGGLVVVLIALTLEAQVGPPSGYFDIPKGYDFPADRQTLEKYRSDQNMDSQRLHVWNVFAGMTQRLRMGSTQSGKHGFPRMRLSRAVPNRRRSVRGGLFEDSANQPSCDQEEVSRQPKRPGRVLCHLFYTTTLRTNISERKSSIFQECSMAWPKAERSIQTFWAIE